MKEKKQFQRLDRIRSGRSGKCGRSGEYLAIPVFMCEGWRRAFPARVPCARTHLRLCAS